MSENVKLVPSCPLCGAACTEELSVNSELTSLRAQLQEAQAEIAAKNTALGIDKMQLLEEMHRMEGEIAEAQDRLSDAKGEIERLNEVRDALTEDAARAENARMDAENDWRSLSTAYIQVSEDFERYRTQLVAAEERAERSEKRSQFNKDNHLAAERENARLTAECESLKKQLAEKK